MSAHDAASDTREVRLDPRDYQDLVDEARTRAGRRCPEWTDHNVSDPGMTLIDQFAWMTDVLLYRVNRIPERLHWKLLELLDVRRQPPTAARAALRFRLAAPPVNKALIAAGTEVSTTPDDQHAAVVFQTGEDATVPVLRLGAMALVRSDVVTTIAVGPDGVARPQGTDREAFSVIPQPNDALYVGFTTSPARLLVQVHVAATSAHGVGIDPDLPPVVWEMARPDGGWDPPVEVLSESTGGFNYPSGMTELDLPQDCVQTTVGGRRLYWLRCRLADHPSPDNRYVDPPQLEEVSANAIGVTTDAQHAMSVSGEVLGTSDGTAGQFFSVLHEPALRLRSGEHLEVSDRGGWHWERWTRRESFADSRVNDHHYRFDPVKGEIQLGPAIRMPGEWVQHGAIPPKGAALRMSRYRYGGGPLGNVERAKLSVLRIPIPGVASVVNPHPARGGNEAEPQGAAILRAADELRTRYRAVTADDFETIALRSSKRVARARCVKPAPGEAIVVQILPGAARPQGPFDPGDLIAPLDLREEVKADLDECSLLGTRVHVTPVALRGVTVAVEVQVGPAADRRDVERRVCDALHAYLNPLVGGDLNAVLSGDAADGNGWEWGRPLSEGELRPLVRGVQDVERIVIMRLYETDLVNGIPIEPAIDGQLVLRPEELIASGRHVARAVLAEDLR